MSSERKAARSQAIAPVVSKAKLHTLCIGFQVKKASAETEPAWKGAGQEIGLKIWRIVKFKVRPVTNIDPPGPSILNCYSV